MIRIYPITRQVRVQRCSTSVVPVFTSSAMPTAQLMEVALIEVLDGNKVRLVRCIRNELPVPGEFITVNGYTITLLGRTIFTWYRAW